LLLGAPGQIVSVSALAHDPAESAYAELAKGIGLNRGAAEDIIPLKPDLVLAGTYTTRASVDLMTQLGIRVLQVPPAADLAEARANLRLLGEALGAKERAEILIADMDARIVAAAKRIAHVGAPQRAVLFRPGEGIAGTQSLSGALLTALHIGNVAAVYGITSWADMSLEEFVQLKPDAIITGESAYGLSIHAEAARHPAFSRSTAPRLTYPDVQLRCGAPVMAAVAEAMASQLEATRP
jgi:iron complex transport system substrate-binding protein